MQSVEVRDHEDNKLVRTRAMTRPDVVDLLAKGKTFATATFNKEKNFWIKDAPLQIIKVETRFIKTKADRTKKDNLENLPSF